MRRENPYKVRQRALRYLAHLLEKNNWWVRDKFVTYYYLCSLYTDVCKRRLEKIKYWHPTNRSFDETIAAAMDSLRRLTKYLKKFREFVEELEEVFRRRQLPFPLSDNIDSLSDKIWKSECAAWDIAEILEELQKATRNWLITPWTKGERRRLHSDVYSELIERLACRLSLWTTLCYEDGDGCGIVATPDKAAEKIRKHLRWTREWRERTLAGEDPAFELYLEAFYSHAFG